MKVKISILLFLDSWVDLEVQLTANHKGHFQFKLCPIKSRSAEATQVKYILFIQQMITENTQYL